MNRQYTFNMMGTIELPEDYKVARIDNDMVLITSTGIIIRPKLTIALEDGKSSAMLSDIFASTIEYDIRDLF